WSETFDCRNHVAEAACSPWVSGLARTAASCDVRTNALHCVGNASLLNFCGNVRLVFDKAVADRSSAWRLFLPHPLTDVRSRENRPVLAEVHDAAPLVRTEAVGVVLIAGQRSRRQHGLDRNRLDRPSRSPAFAASGRRAG